MPNIVARDRGTEDAHLSDVLQFHAAAVGGPWTGADVQAHDRGDRSHWSTAARTVRRGPLPGAVSRPCGDVLHVHPSTLTGALQRLVTQRLLVRAADPGDRRRAVLRLTTRGARANAVRQGTVEAAIAEALDGVSDRDRVATRRVLELLAAELDRSLTQESPPRSRSRRRGSTKGVAHA